MSTPHCTPTIEYPPDRDAIADAQHAGDRAYARAQAAGLPREAWANHYHRAFALRLWTLGESSACACQFCQWLNATAPDDQAQPAPVRITVTADVWECPF